MKFHGSTLVFVLALMMVGESMAQTIRMKADVPFEFIVNGSTLPPGQYTIQSFGIAVGRTLQLRNSDKTQSTNVNAINVESLKSSPQTKLVFHRYGSRYFLSQVWIEGNDRGHQLPKSHRESELARDYDHHFQEVDLVVAMR